MTDCKFVSMEFSRSSVLVMWVGTFLSKTSVVYSTIASHWIFLTQYVHGCTCAHTCMLACHYKKEIVISTGHLLSEFQMSEHKPRLHVLTRVTLIMD